MTVITSILQTAGWGATTGAAFAFTFYAKAYNKEQETFSWKKFLPTVTAGAILGAIAAVFNQDFSTVWGLVGGFTGSLLLEIYKAFKANFS